MIEDKPIDLKMENRRLGNELSLLRQKNEELKEDRDYIKSLLDVEFEKRIKLSKDNEQLKQQLNDITLNWTQNHLELDKDELYVKDNNTEITLKGQNLFIQVFIPKIKEYFRFNYIVTGRRLEKGYNTLKDDVEMTEKKQRFKYRKGFYFEFDDIKYDLDFYEIDLEPNSNEFDDSNLFYLYATSESNIIHLTERLNKLHEENEQLKNEVYDWKASAEDYLKLGKSLKEENEQLKEKFTSEKKQKENWAFVADCSVQVMNDEEEFKEEYLTVATNELKKMIEENEQLKSDNRLLQSRNTDLKRKNELYDAENEQLKKFKKQAYSIINNKINELAMTKSYGDVHNDLRVFAQRVLIDVKKEFDNPTYENCKVNVE